MLEKLFGPPMPPTFDPATLQPHPYANQFDMIEDGEEGGAAFEALKTSIAKIGIKTPIKIFEGKVLNGLNRLRAALAVGHKFTARDFHTFIGTQEDAKACVDAANIHRRHHSKEQKDRLIRASQIRTQTRYTPALVPQSLEQIVKELSVYLTGEHPNVSDVSHTRVNNVRKPSKTKKRAKAAKNKRRQAT